MSEKGRVRFYDTEPRQAGGGIRELLCRSRLTVEQFAAKAGITPGYLADLQQGRYDEVSPDIIERILEAGGVSARGKGTRRSGEELKLILLAIKGPSPPIGGLF